MVVRSLHAAHGRVLPRIDTQENAPLMFNFATASRWDARSSDGLPRSGTTRARPRRLQELDGTGRAKRAGRIAVFHVDAHTTALVKTLMAQYADHADRSPKIENQLWHALFDLTQSFQVCYAAFARDITDHGHHHRWQAMLPELIARQLVHLGKDVKIRLYRCEPWIPAKWAELHAVFTRACALQVERQPLILYPSGGPSTIERSISSRCFSSRPIRATSLPARSVGRQKLDEWCRPLRLAGTALRGHLLRDLASNVGFGAGRSALEARSLRRCASAAARCSHRTAPSSSRR
jgi:hypothetical protein